MQTKIESYNVDNLKIGVISDAQITPIIWKKETQFEKNLMLALKTFKNNDCNMIIFAGDICNKGAKSAYKRFLNCYYKVFGNNLPIMQNIMGNHDYLYGILPSSYYRNIFENSLKQSAFTHIVVNGYHFIGASPYNSSMKNGYKKVREWLIKQIEIAKKDNPNNPIFVTTHSAPRDTVYGSCDWYDKNLDDIFQKYENLINFSGHSHYSILDERSFSVKNYSALNTQSISYIELERGKENGTIPPMAYNNPMGYIVTFDNKKIIAHRYDLKNNIEIKSQVQWQIFPKQVRDLEKSITLPYFDENFISYELVNNMTQLIFSRAKNNDIIPAYKIVINDKDTQLYFSDYYIDKVIDNQNQRLVLCNVKRGVYNIKVYALDSLNRQSKNYLEIKNVPVIKKIKYKKVQTPEKLNYRF